ncbi:hypothetical protein Fcan01_15743 [Folsomia candida]|uniref:Uncharacterized protein n=1 Tax=Folsomia candida TaxID=158441 RepID=A0A226DY10_FOLCA|nr:hypothetical protein Fcan01_15743 [Folsomia candida]
MRQFVYLILILGFSHFSTNFGFIANRSFSQIRDSDITRKPKALELALTFDIFSNCTTLVDIGNGQAVPSGFPFVTNPIVIVGRTKIQYKFFPIVAVSLTRRKNIIGHCWAFVTILPENEFTAHLKGDSNFSPDLWEYFERKQYHVGDNRHPKYLVWLTQFKTHFQKQIQTLSVKLIAQVGSYNFVLISVSSDFVSSKLELIAEEAQLSLHCYNRYYAKSITSASPPWLKITCDSDQHINCFNKLSHFTEEISHLNKYFWEVDVWTDITKRGWNHDNVATWSIKLKYFTQLHILVDLREIAKVTGFDEFLGYWIFQDILFDLVNKSRNEVQHMQNVQKVHYLSPKAELAYRQHSIVPIESKSLSFLSCHGVGHHTSIISQLFTPFEKYVWLLISLIILTVLIFLNAPKLDTRVTFLLIGILLENSVLLPHEKTIVSGQIRFRLLSGFYAVFLGTVLTNYYKTSFTKEMILPVEQTAPWHTILDTANFTFYIPYGAILTGEDIGGIKERRTLDQIFYAELFFRFDARSKCDNVEGSNHVLLGYCDLADSFANSITFPYSVFQNETEVFSPSLRSISYKEVSNFVEKLSTCNRSAYLDVDENLPSVAAFLNDNQDGKVFKKSEGGFMKGTHGWENDPVQNSFVWNRLKIIIYSGIFNFWNDWFRRTRPVKLFQHYANWTYSRSNAMNKVQFGSKIVTGFYMYGICIGVCVICGFLEIIVLSLQKRLS